MEALFQKLKTGSTAERIAAIKAIGETGDSSAIEVLEEILNGLRRPYEETIIVPGGWGNYYDSHPETTVTHDPDRDLREAITEAIDKLAR